jgi:hypothetical protein
MKTGSRAADPTLQVPLAGWEHLACSCAIPAGGGIADGWARLSFPGGPGFSLWLHWDRMSETPLRLLGSS